MSATDYKPKIKLLRFIHVEKYFLICFSLTKNFYFNISNNVVCTKKYFLNIGYLICGEAKSQR